MKLENSFIIINNHKKECYNKKNLMDFNSITKDNIEYILISCVLATEHHYYSMIGNGQEYFIINKFLTQTITKVNIDSINNEFENIKYLFYFKNNGNNFNEIIELIEGVKT